MNAQHAKLLKKSVAAWNEWRLQNPQIQPDLGREPFSFANLTGADLLEFDMSASLDLRGADLSGANLTGQDLITANLTRANLSGANLSEAELRHANLSGAKLNGADLTGADLTEAEVINADFSEAQLDGTRLEGATFSSSTIWPSGFDPVLRGAQKRSAMDFVEEGHRYLEPLEE